MSFVRSNKSIMGACWGTEYWRTEKDQDSVQFVCFVVMCKTYFLCAGLRVSPEFMSFHSWSTRASLQREDSVALVKGGFLASMPKILCLDG